MWPIQSMTSQLTRCSLGVQSDVIRGSSANASEFDLPCPLCPITRETCAAASVPCYYPTCSIRVERRCNIADIWFLVSSSPLPFHMHPTGACYVSVTVQVVLNGTKESDLRFPILTADAHGLGQPRTIK